MPVPMPPYIQRLENTTDPWMQTRSGARIALLYRVWIDLLLGAGVVIFRVSAGGLIARPRTATVHGDARWRVLYRIGRMRRDQLDAKEGADR